IAFWTNPCGAPPPYYHPLPSPFPSHTAQLDTVTRWCGHRVEIGSVGTECCGKVACAPFACPIGCSWRIAPCTRGTNQRVVSDMRGHATITVAHGLYGHVAPQRQ